MIEETGLHEHDTRGNHITWSNKHTNWVIYLRIDRDIYNEDWFLTYPNYEIETLNPHISNHYPFRVNMEATNTEVNRCITRFNFLDCVVERPEFMNIVNDSWSKTDKRKPMYILLRKLETDQEWYYSSN